MWRGATLWLSVFSRAPAPPPSRDLATKDRRRDQATVLLAQASTRPRRTVAVAAQQQCSRSSSPQRSKASSSSCLHAGVHLERALFDADTNCNGLTLRGCSLERATLAHTSLERLTVQGGSMAEALSTPRCL